MTLILDKPVSTGGVTLRAVVRQRLHCRERHGNLRGWASKAPVAILIDALQGPNLIMLDEGQRDAVERFLATNVDGV